MTDCCGLMGKIFCYCFKKKKTKFDELCELYKDKPTLDFYKIKRDVGEEIRGERCGRKLDG